MDALKDFFEVPVLFGDTDSNWVSNTGCGEYSLKNTHITTFGAGVILWGLTVINL